MSKKILFVNFYCNNLIHHYTHIELMIDAISKGDNVYSLGCYAQMSAPCCSNPFCDQCGMCSSILDKSLMLINMAKSNILKLRATPPLVNIPNFNTIEEIKNFCVEDINIGFSTVSYLSDILQEHLFSIHENKKNIEHFLQQDSIVLKSMEYYFKKYRFDEVYVFNGRLPVGWPILQYCIKNNIDYYLTERGANKYKYDVVKNQSLHKLRNAKDRMLKYWLQGSIDKEDISKKWFEDRKNGYEQSWYSFTASQKQNKLPELFDKNKENIAIFNSSLYEGYYFDDYKNPVDREEHTIIFKIVDFFKDDLNKHFYLRMHPNLTNKNSTQYRELVDISEKGYKNLTVIFPDENISTYALMENSTKVLVFGSTMGVESAFWGKPVILAGHACYEDLGCAYIAENFEDLFRLIGENLKPKDRNSTLPYAYWQSVHGFEFKYYEPFDLFQGEFCGLDLRYDEVSPNIYITYLKKLKNKKYKEIEELRLNISWLMLFGISNNNDRIRITLFGFKFTFKVTDKIINKIAWLIPIRKLRDNFRHKFQK